MKLKVWSSTQRRSPPKAATKSVNGLSTKLQNKETYSCLLYCILRSDVTKARPREPLAILVEAKISLLNLL